jgi:hypothetical protein
MLTKQENINESKLGTIVLKGREKPIGVVVVVPQKARKNFPSGYYLPTRDLGRMPTTDVQLKIPV